MFVAVYFIIIFCFEAKKNQNFAMTQYVNISVQAIEWSSLVFL